MLPLDLHNTLDRVGLSLLVLTIEGLAQLVFGPSSCVNILYKTGGKCQHIFVILDHQQLFFRAIFRILLS